MYIVKDSEGTVINEYSKEDVKPGRVLYTIKNEEITILACKENQIVFSYNNKRYQSSIESVESIIHKKLFFDIYNCDYDYYDENGYNQFGYNELSYDCFGYDKYGYDELGYNHSGYDKNGYNRDGFDRDGYNKEGFDRCHRDKDGYDKTGYNVSGYDRNNNFWVDKAKELPNGVEERIYNYLCTNKGIILECAECTGKFFVSFETIDFLKKKDYEIPKRCKKCREEKKKKIQSKGKYYGLEESRKRDNLIKTPTGREQYYRFYGPNMEE